MKNNLPPWRMDRRSIMTIDDFPKDAVGFIYTIYLDNGKYYIGKKSLWFRRKRNFGKKEAALITDKRKKLYEHIVKESDWESYVGSNKELVEDLKRGANIIERKIDWVASTEKQLTYYETSFLFEKKVLIDPNSYNDNILGKFFRKDLV